MSKGRVLSIQSHVVSGYVGNKAAVFPLQLLGFDVDIANSTHFSNHTGYAGGFEGDVLQGDQLRAILAGLERNDLLRNIRHLLTGYIGSKTFLRSVLHVIKKLKDETGGRVRYVCDPVLGDNKRFYVPQELVEVYKMEIIPLADVVTPNQFEVEALTGNAIKNVDDAIDACKALHDMGPGTVIITSIEFDANPGELAIFASQRNKDKTEIWRIDSPLIEGRYTGTGDLCASLFLAWTASTDQHSQSGGNIKECLEKVVATMQCVIRRTYENSSKQLGKLSDANQIVFARELMIVSSKHEIENPPKLHEAYLVKITK